MLFVVRRNVPSIFVLIVLFVSECVSETDATKTAEGDFKKEWMYMQYTYSTYNMIQM